MRPQYIFLEPDSEVRTETPRTHKSKGGGITCCVPHCYNNSQRNPNLSFYVIPKDPAQRKKWLIKISRKDFVPSISHRVCSDHFVGGKKSYMNNVPTIVPKTIKPTEWKPRKTLNSSGNHRSPLSPIRASNTTERIEQQLEQELNRELDRLTVELQELKVKFTERENELKGEVHPKIIF